MEKNIAAQLTNLLSSSNGGRRLSAADGEVVEKATNFLSSAIAALGDATTNALDKVANLKGTALQEGLDSLTADLTIDSAWGANMGGGQFITAMKEATSLAEAQDVWESYEDELCEPWSMNIEGPHQGDFEDGDFFLQKVPTKCKGPEIKLEYKPKECIVSDDDHSIECKPGKIVMKKKPGECVLKHWRPFTWASKECKAKTEFYKKSDDITTEGGEEYTLWFDQLEKPLVGALDGLHKKEETVA